MLVRNQDTPAFLQVPDAAVSAYCWLLPCTIAAISHCTLHLLKDNKALQSDTVARHFTRPLLQYACMPGCQRKKSVLKLCTFSTGRQNRQTQQTDTMCRQSRQTGDAGGVRRRLDRGQT